MTGGCRLTWRGCGLSAAFIFAVIECGECQDVEEKQRRTNGDGDAELGGIVARISDDQWAGASGGAWSGRRGLCRWGWGPCGGGGGVVEHVV